MYSDIIFITICRVAFKLSRADGQTCRREYSHFTILRNRPLMMNMSPGVFPQTVRETTEMNL